MAGPGSYKSPTLSSSCGEDAALDLEVFVLDANETAPRLPERTPRFVSSSQGAEDELAHELPSPAKGTKSVRWSEHLADIIEFECFGRSGSTSSNDNDTEDVCRPRLPARAAAMAVPQSEAGSVDRPPRLPKSSADRSICLPAELALRRNNDATIAAAAPAAPPKTDTPKKDVGSKPRLPRGAAGMLNGSIMPLFQKCAGVKPETPQMMERLAEVGLLQVIWPARRVVMGMCVCKLLKGELVSCPKVVIHVRPGRDIPADHVLKKVSGTIFVSADIAGPPAKPSDKTKSIKSFMKSLLADDDAEVAHQIVATKTKTGNLPVTRLRTIRHRIHRLDLDGCSLGRDSGVGISTLLYTYQYRGRAAPQNDMGALQELMLARNELAAAPVLFAAIASLPNLMLLDLSKNNLGVSGCKALAAPAVLGKCQHLHTLDISANEVSDEGLGHICVSLPLMMQLHKLVSASNNIGDVGAEGLAQVLPQCASLVEVDLSCNVMSDEGQWMLAAARVQCRLGGGVGGAGGGVCGRLVNIDVRRYLDC
jgi:hypothetical protein